MSLPAHEYDKVTVGSLVETVKAYTPGDVVVIVRDAYGEDVKTFSAIRSRLTEEEGRALLAGDVVTTADGARMEKAR